MQPLRTATKQFHRYKRKIQTIFRHEYYIKVGVKDNALKIFVKLS